MIEKKKKLVPKRRFSEFKDFGDWEQRKLGQLGEFSSNGVDKKINIKDISVNLLNYMDVYNRRKLDNKNCDKLMQVTATDYQLERNDVKANDVFFTPSSETPDDIGRVMVIEENLDNTVYSYHLMRFRPNTNTFHSIFPNYVLDTNFFRKQLTFEAQGVQRFVLNRGSFEKLMVNLPSIEEQVQISKIFRYIDNLITLHQRKLESLKKLKKAYLNEMFPSENELLPVRRFEGFTSDWEQRKLADGTSKIGDGLHGTPVYADEGNVYFINGNNLVNGKIVITEETKCVTEDEQSKDDNALDDNTLLMSINGTIGNLAWYNGEKLMLGKSAAYITVSDFDKRFIYAYLQTPSIYSYFMSNLTGSTIKNLGLKTIRETKLLVPKKEEQIQIGTFFRNLDNLVTLHQRKLEKLEDIKKAYLNEMFV